MDFVHKAPLAIAVIGLLMGMRHATDPDHVIAVTTIVSHERALWKASRIGAVWGLGHTATVLAVGAMIIVGKLAIPVRVGLGMEFAVAIVLILLGIRPTGAAIQRLVVRLGGRVTDNKARALIVHSHGHRHGGLMHRHPHVHAIGQSAHAADEAHTSELEADAVARFSLAYPRLRAFVVGLVHGLAGSAAIALLVLGAIPNPLWATLYLAVFCAGTIVGMALITTAIATPIAVARGRLQWMHRGLVSGAGLVSFGFGLFLAYRIIAIDNLFSAAPSWIPH